MLTTCTMCLTSNFASPNLCRRSATLDRKGNDNYRILCMWYQKSTAWFREEEAVCEVVTVTSRIRSHFRRCIKHFDSSRSKDYDSWGFFVQGRSYSIDVQLLQLGPVVEDIVRKKLVLLYMQNEWLTSMLDTGESREVSSWFTEANTTQCSNFWRNTRILILPVLSFLKNGLCSFFFFFFFFLRKGRFLEIYFPTRTASLMVWTDFFSLNTSHYQNLFTSQNQKFKTKTI